MKRIEKISVNDRSNIQVMSNDKSLSSYPLLKEHRAKVVVAYQRYRELVEGSVPSSHPLLPEPLAQALKTHYTSGCAQLGFIATVRSELSPGVCPMCGSASPATVDHVLPKSPWPVFSIFSYNLVPACDQCNRKKNDSYGGETPNSRPIHPYIDDFLLTRVVIARLVPPYSTPIVEIVPVAGLAPETGETVEWHLENVVRKTSIANTLKDRWITLVRNPRQVLEALKFGAGVEAALQSRLVSHDTTFGTPNNWESMLIAGILADQSAVDYLKARVEAGTIEENPAA